VTELAYFVADRHKVSDELLEHLPVLVLRKVLTELLSNPIHERPANSRICERREWLEHHTRSLTELTEKIREVKKDRYLIEPS
jgi:hypothetical protein